MVESNQPNNEEAKKKNNPDPLASDDEWTPIDGRGNAEWKKRIDDKL